MLEHEDWDFIPEYEDWEVKEDFEQETELQRHTAQSIMDDLNRQEVQGNIQAWYDRGCQKKLENLTWDEVRISDGCEFFNATDYYIGYDICIDPFVLDNYNSDGTMKPQRYQFLVDSGVSSEGKALEELRVRRHLRKLSDLVMSYGKPRARHFMCFFERA